MPKESNEAVEQSTALREQERTGGYYGRTDCKGRIF